LNLDPAKSSTDERPLLLYQNAGIFDSGPHAPRWSFAQRRIAYTIGNGVRGCPGKNRAGKRENSSSGPFVCNTGTDVLAGDPPGGMNITPRGDHRARRSKIRNLYATE